MHGGHRTSSRSVNDSSRRYNFDIVGLDKKFRVRIPTTIEEALAIDGDNESNLWENATLKEINGVRVAFDIKEKGGEPPPG